MKKLLVAVMVLLMLLVAVLPASASGDEPPYGPPGWSYQNPGEGGSDNPGLGGPTVDAATSSQRGPTSGRPGWARKPVVSGSDDLGSDALSVSDDPGQGGSPGWSHVSPGQGAGQGGSDSPGAGSKIKADKDGAIATGLAASDDEEPSPWDHCNGKRNFPVPPHWSQGYQ